MNTVNKLGLGEYNAYGINKANQVVDFTAGIPQLVAKQPANVVDVEACLHHQALIDNNGNLYWWGQSSVVGTINGIPATTVGTPTQIASNVKQAAPFCNGMGGDGILFVKNDGTVWIHGCTLMGFRGDGTPGQVFETTPVQIQFPAGVVIEQVEAGIWCGALDTTGTLWSWGGGGTTGDPQYWPTYLLARGFDHPDYTRPGKVALPAPIAFGDDVIAIGGLFNYVVLSNGATYGWAYNTEYMNQPAGQGKNTPWAVDKQLGLPAMIAKIYTSVVASHAILTNGDTWAWGDNACGFIGNGKELNFAAYKSPYNWDWGKIELPQIPVQIAVGVQLVKIWTGLGDVFYAYAEDINGQLYSWGRNKGGVLGNGVLSPDKTGSETANLPNSWDVPWVTPIDPFNVKVISWTPSPKNKPATSIPASIDAGLDQSIVGNVTGLLGIVHSGFVNYWFWTQVSGPNIAQIILQTAQAPVVKGLIPGTYVFKVTATDNNWNVITDTLQVVVSSPAPPPPVPPTVSAGSDNKIQLPVNLYVLLGTASGNGGASIVGYQWSQINGPNTASLIGKTSAMIAAADLILGTYIFGLTVTDSNLLQASAQVTVTVDPAPLPIPPKKIASIIVSYDDGSFDTLKP